MSGVFARLSPAAWHDCSHQIARAAIGAKPLAYPASMQGKTCVITGATSGIGRAAAEALAAMGARVVMIARDKQRGEAMLTQLRDRFPLAGHSVHYADLLRLAEVKRAAADIAAAEPRVDVLLNNAGAMFASRKITPDGFERTFALNHVAPFVLTHGLRQRLFAAAPARVVNTSGCLNHLATLHLDDLRLEHRYNAFYAYAHAKLCCVLFTRELARRAAPDGIVAQCMHPGVIDSNFMSHADEVMRAYMKTQTPQSPEHAARTLVFLATSPEAGRDGGRYFHDGKEVAPAPQALDEAAARRLWDETEKLLAKLGY